MQKKIQEYEIQRLNHQIKALSEIMEKERMSFHDSLGNPTEAGRLMEELVKKRDGIADQKYRKDNLSRLCFGIIILLVAVVILALSPLVFMQPSRSVTSGWILLFGFIPIPVFFLASPTFWGIVMIIVGLAIAGASIKIFKGD